MHVYLDDIFVYSESIEEHEEHLRVVFERLRQAKLYLKWKKCDLYANCMDCLGHIIDRDGIHVDEDKLTCIRDWRIPRNYNDLQWFVGLVNYIGSFLPNIMAYTGPLLSMTQNGALFIWHPIHQQCFDIIKCICSTALIIKPIDSWLDEPIWHICDASKSGVGAIYGQGPSWKTCRPAGFISQKFLKTQQNYAVHKLKTLAILEFLQKWEDKLVGYKIHVITDHKALEFFKTQNRLTNQQRRWMDYLSRFNFDITYTKGELNKIADCLLWYYKSDTVGETHNINEYVCVDPHIDLEEEDLPLECHQEIVEHVIEIRAMWDTVAWHSQRLVEHCEECDVEAEAMAEPRHQPGETMSTYTTCGSGDDNPIEEDETLGKALLHQNADPPPTTKNNDAFKQCIKGGYPEDKLFSAILKKPGDYKLFSEWEGLIWMKNLIYEEVLCISRDCELVHEIITQVHKTLGHFGEQKMADYIHHWYWWPGIMKDTRTFCRSCESCKWAKGSNQPPKGKLHPLPISTKPWDSIEMDFIVYSLSPKASITFG